MWQCAARVMSVEATPEAISPSVLQEQGRITRPTVATDPDATGAARSASSQTWSTLPASSEKGPHSFS